MLDAEKIQELEKNKSLSEEEVSELRQWLVKKISGQGRTRGARNGIVYVVLAFCLGSLGIHNFYAGYWKRGVVQLLLSAFASYMMYVPLIFTSIWALIELLFVNRGSGGVLFTGNPKIIWLLRTATILILVWAAASVEMVVPDVNFDVMEEF